MKHILILPSSYSSVFNTMSAPFFRDQALALQIHGAKVGVLCPLPISLKRVFVNFFFKFGCDEYNDQGIQTCVYTFPSVPKSFRFNSYVRYVLGKRLLKKYILEFGKPDIIHVHNFFSGKIAIWAKKKYNIPYVITEHSSAFLTNSLNKSQLRLATEVFSKSNYNISVSNGFSDFLSQAFKLNFQTIPNLVDVNFFELSNSISKKKKFNFLNIGHLNDNKNQLFLIKQFLKKFGGHSQMILTVAGSGPNKDKIIDYLKIFDKYNQVRLFSAPDRKGVLELFQNADCLVVSSKIETFSVVIIEALSCGIPVVSIKSVGPSSILTDRVGILCDNNDLGESLLKIFENRFSYKKDVLRNFVVENYSDKIVSKSLLNVYDKVCDSK